MNTNTQKLIHMVYFWLRSDEHSTQAKTELIAGLETLAAIDLIKAMHIGVPASTLERDVIDSSYHVSLVLQFDSPADQDAYQIHPVHLAFVDKCNHLWQTVKVCDSIAV